MPTTACTSSMATVKPVHHQHHQRPQQHVQHAAAAPEEDLDDLGRQLSPLGSTSSLQDLVEASSARASVDPNSQSSSSWIEKERLKVSFFQK